MNLGQIYKLLVAADEQRHGSLVVTGPREEQDVREMAKVGLVEAVLSDGKKGSCTAIKRVTPEGHTFLRVFAGKLTSPKNGESASLLWRGHHSA